MAVVQPAPVGEYKHKKGTDTGASHRGKGVKLQCVTLPTSVLLPCGKHEVMGGEIMPLN